MRTILTLILTSIGAVALVSGAGLAQTPSEAQQQAIRSSCVSDYRANCAGVPPHGMQALACLEQHEAKLSSACKSAVDAVGSGAATAASGGSAQPASGTAGATAPATDATAAPATSAEAGAGASAASGAMRPTPPGPELSFRQEMRLAANACARDFRLFCPNLPVGHGNVLFCLKVNGAKLDPPCRDALRAAGVEF